VPIVVREVSDRESLELALVENIQRDDLSPLEEAAAYQRLIDTLLDSPGYADYFANKWSSLLRNKRPAKGGARGTFTFYGWLHDAHTFALSEAHVMQALAEARRPQSPGAPVAQGSVGAGRGMSCHGLKGGIGSASRCLTWARQRYTMGALVLANQGRLDALTLAGVRVGPVLQQRLAARSSTAEESGPERGSIIMLLATDAPLDARQLQRVARRAGAGLARTGSDYGHGSGDIALAFSTAYRVPQHASENLPMPRLLHESALDLLFQAAAEATEQAIVHALFAAATVTGRDGHTRHALTELAPDGSALLASRLSSS